MNKQANKMVQCICNNDVTENYCGAQYFKFTESREKTMLNSLKAKNAICGLMLQHCEKKSMCHTMRTDWKELIFDEERSEAVFGLPRHRKAKYVNEGE